MKVNIGRYLKKSNGRKIDVQIDKFDTWSLDHTLALIILPALIQLKHTKHGVPSDFVDDTAQDYHSQTVFDFMLEDKDDVFQKGCDKWEETLDKMIWSFQQIALEDYDDKYHHGEMKMGWEDTKKNYTNSATGKTETTYRLIDLNPGEHWYDSDGHQLHEQRIQEGLELFGKYYRALWD
jgi:hypothetical protein